MSNDHHPDNAIFARSLMGGKRSARVESRVTDETKFALARRCHELGMTESDYVANLVEVSLFGFDHVASVQASRLRGVCGSSGLVPTEAQP